LVEIRLLLSQKGIHSYFFLLFTASSCEYVWRLYVKGNVEADKLADKGAKMPPIENKIYKG
jgi:hypothetical protein